MKRRSILLTSVILGMIKVMSLLPAIAESDDRVVSSKMEKLLETVDFEFHNLNFAQVKKPVDSELNPDNRLKISRYTLGSDFRPNLKIVFPVLDIIFKPRLELRWDRWEDGLKDGETETDEDMFVNEWLIRVHPVNPLFLSYGREDLQWGPSFLLSPSNPFYTDNGRDRPKIEVAGADYGRLVWVPNLQWTCSFIVNTDEGHKELLTPFRKTYAAKIDYLAEEAYFSIILSKQESYDSRLGGFLSWNINDANVLYAEGSGSDDEVEFLVGTSYTFIRGGTFAFEYFYNGGGTSDGSLVMELASLDAPSARETLFRKNYLLVQYYDQDTLGFWNAFLRGTIGLDDESFSILAHGEFNIGDHSQLFATGTIYSGDDESEFGSLLDYRVQVGVEFYF